MGRAIIILLTGFIMILSGYRGNMRDSATISAAGAYEFYSEKQTKLVAESGARVALTKLALEPEWRDELLDVAIAGGTADIRAIDRADIGADVVQVHAVGEFNGSEDSINVVFSVIEPSERFSRYSYFSNREDNIWFYSADTLSGPVHSNDQFNMTGAPVFYGLVSSVSSTYNTLGWTSPNFYGGTDFGRSSIDLSPDFTALWDAAFDGGHFVLNNTLYLRFQNDGTYQFKVGSGGSWQSQSIPANGVIASNRNIYVEGTINGKVTVATTKSVYVTNDIIYSDDPIANPDSEDVLGLVAFENVIVQDNSDNRDQVRIHATILVRDGSFRAENIDFTPSTRLELLGGIVQEVRGPVGMLGSPPSGFKKFYQYDDRLEYIYPPFYPVAGGALEGSQSKAKITILYWR